MATAASCQLRKETHDFPESWMKHGAAAGSGDSNLSFF
jgi:hypothetical protein